MNQNLSDIISKYVSEVNTALTKLPVRTITDVIHAIEKARDERRSIFIFGNGGSAATALHFAADLAKGAICPGKPRIKAFALTDNISLLSAWANDSAYEDIFAEQLQNYIEPGDIAIAISGSGNSPNILDGIKVAKAKGATTIGFIGFEGGKLKGMVDIAIVIPGSDMKPIEDIHLLIGHIITVCLRGET